MSLIIVSASRARKAARASGASGWCYLGTDTARRDRLAAALKPLPRRDIGEDLDRAARRTTPLFLDWLANLGARQKNPLVWYASALSSKSPLLTDFFLLVCYAQAVREWSRDRDWLVVVEDPWLLTVLEKRFAGGSETRVSGGGLPRLLKTLVALAREPLAKLYLFFWSLNARLRSRSAFGEGADPAGSGATAMIHTWIEPRSFAKPGELSDAYTERLGAILESGGSKVARLTPLKFPNRFLKPLREVRPDAVLPAAFLTVSDLFAGAGFRFTIDLPEGAAAFEGWDLSPLLRRETLKERGHPAAATYSLWHAAHARIARKWSGSLKSLFYTSENQPWERMLCAAWRENAPGVRLIGYQHASVCPLMLNYFLGNGESARVPLPDRLVANGEAALSLLREDGYPAGFLENGGALRFEALHKNLPAAAAPDGTERKVLVAFPFSRDYGMGLFRDLQDVLKEPLNAPGLEKPVLFVLKFHPWFPIEKFGGDPKALPPWMTVSNEPLGRALKGCDLMLYAPPTTSWAEAVLAGVPAMKFRGDLLDIDFAESWKGVTVPVCTRESLRDAVAKALTEERRRPPDPAALLESLFGRVREDLWKELAR